jgi:predicted permease
MTSLLGLFAANLLPILAIAAVGALVAAAFRLEARPLSLVTFHVFSPALVFKLISESTLGGAEVARMIAFAALAILVPGACAAVWARLTRLSRPRAAAFVLVAMCVNAGNYGLSLVSLAFGEPALAQAAVFFATSVTLNFTVGVTVASLGHADARAALTGVLRVPAVYAVAAAFLVKAAGWTLPLPVQRSYGLLAEAAIPGMLVVLGMQLYKSGRLKPEPGLAPAVALRLLGGPLVALLAARALGLVGPARQAGIVEASVPTAVLTTVFSDTYCLEPEFIAQGVLLSTLLSPLTLTPLLALLGA